MKSVAVVSSTINRAKSIIRCLPDHDLYRYHAVTASQYTYNFSLYQGVVDLDGLIFPSKTNSVSR